MSRLAARPRCALPLALALAQLSATSRAAEDLPAPEADLEDIYVVWGSRADPEGPTVDEVGAEELQRQGARSAAQALERLPSATASTGARGERIFVLRGFDQRQTAVLIDGAPAHLPVDGQLDLDLLPAELIERITVVKGPGSVLFGPTGLGGAVHIVTRQPGRGPLLELRGEAAGPDRARLALSHGQQVGPVGYAIFGGGEQRTAWHLSSRFVPTRMEDGGDRLNSDRRGVHAGAAGQLTLGSAHTVRALALIVDAERGIPPSTVNPVPDFRRWSEWRALLGSISHRGRYLDALQVDEIAFVRWFVNTLDGYDDASYTTQDTARAFHSLYDDMLAGGGVRGRLSLEQLPWGVTSLRLWSGAQLEAHHEGSTTEALAPRSQRALLTAAPEVEVLFTDWLSAVAGCQLDLELPASTVDEPLQPAVGVGPLLSTTLRPADSLMLRATVAHRVRFATLKERFASASGNRLPNPTLRPESAWHSGLDASWRITPRLTVEGSVYDAEVVDLIDRVTVGGGLEQMQNLGAARLLGTEAALRLRPARNLELQLGHAWLLAQRLDVEVPYLPYRPEHKAQLGAVLWPLRWLELDSLVRLVGPQHYQHPLTRDWDTLASYAVWDARARVRPRPGVELWLQGSNLLDTSFATEVGYPDPGRQIWLGLRMAAGDRDRSAATE